jgi:PTS system nitrogen regulatory IIA component
MAATPRTTMKIEDVFKEESVILELESSSKPEVIRELASKVSSVYPNINAQDLAEVLLQREKLCSTALDSGVAIPHAKLGGISSIIVAFGRSTKGIEFESLDSKPTHLFMLVVAPESSAGAHLKLLARISNIFRSPGFRKKLMEAQTEEEIYNLIIEEDEKY